MRLSVMLFPFHKELADGTLSPKTMIEEFHRVGIRALEPMMLWAEQNAPKWAEVERAAADLGMVYSCLDVGVNFVGENESDRAKAIDIVARGVEMAQRLKCPIILLPGTRPSAGMSNEEGRKIYSEGLAKAAERTRGSGVILTIEDFGVYPHFACSSTHCIEVLDGARPADIRFTFDNGNFLLADERPVDCWKRLEARTVHVHIKDFAQRPPDNSASLTTPSGKKYKGCDIGAGEAQVKDCLALIKRSLYAGWISLEVGTQPPLRSAIQGAQYVTEAWKTV